MRKHLIDVLNEFQNMVHDSRNNITGLIMKFQPGNHIPLHIHPNKSRISSIASSFIFKERRAR